MSVKMYFILKTHKSILYKIHKGISESTLITRLLEKLLQYILVKEREYPGYIHYCPRTCAIVQHCPVVNRLDNNIMS